jgi:hypothetical protein
MAKKMMVKVSMGIEIVALERELRMIARLS